MRKTSIIALLAGALSIPSIASADDAYDDSGRHGGYGYRTPVAEVSADPRDGADLIDIHTRARFSRLELRAREAPVRLRGVQVRFDDGHKEDFWMHRVLAPGQSTFIELPRRHVIDKILVDYGDSEHRRWDRTPARLEIFGYRARGDGHRYDDDYRDRYRGDRGYPKYEQYPGSQQYPKR